MASLADLYEAIKEHSGMEDDQLAEAGQHGADAGWPGFCYTSECCEFFDANASRIWQLAVERAEEFGCMNVADMIAGFTRSDMLDDWDTFRNLLAWFALEEVGRSLDSGR